MRAHFADVAIDQQGNAIEAEISVFLRSSSTLAAIYATETANSALPNPYIISDGIVSHWADAGAYDVLIHDTSSPPRVNDRVIGWGAVPGVDRGIPGRLLEDLGITGAKIAVNAVDGTKIAGGSIGTGHLLDGAVTAQKVAADLATQSELDAETAARIAADTPEAWTRFAYQNGWVDNDSSQVGRYMKDPHGFVHLEGVIRNTVGFSWGTASATPFALPAGYRPFVSRDFAAAAHDPNGNGIIVLTVQAGGNVVGNGGYAGASFSGGIGGYWNLNGITYRAER